MYDLKKQNKNHDTGPVVIFFWLPWRLIGWDVLFSGVYFSFTQLILLLF